MRRSEALTPFNPLKLLRHADKVSAMLAGGVVYPVSVEIDLSNTCNHGCPWCSFNGFRQANWVQFPTPRLLTLLDELAEVGVQSLTFTGGGEPLVHKDAAAAFLRAVSRGMAFGVVTNGFNLVGEKRDIIARHATFCRVSLDAGTPQTHQLLHATHTPEFHRILANLTALREAAGARLTIGASMCVFDVNVDEIGLAARHVKDHGGNYLEVRPVFPTEWRGGGFARALSDANIDRAKAALDAAQETLSGPDFQVIGMIPRFDQLKTTGKPYGACRIGPLTTVINADGSIYHCCVQRGVAAFRVASVLKQSFREVWMTSAHQALMAGIDVQTCPPCRYDMYNSIIEEAFMGDALHGKFL